MREAMNGVESGAAALGRTFTPSLHDRLAAGLPRALNFLEDFLQNP
jgi:hypothetical protein